MSPLWHPHQSEELTLSILWSGLKRGNFYIFKFLNF